LGGVLRKDTHDHIIRALTHQEAAYQPRPSRTLLQSQLDAFDQQIFVFMSASAGYLRREVQMATFRSDSSGFRFSASSC
jgi:hypothetical protein